MKTILNELLNYLTLEQLNNKEIIEIEYNSHLSKIIGNAKVTVEITGATKEIIFAGLGKADSYNGIMDLVYKNKQGNLVIRPKLIKMYLGTE